MAFSVSFEGKKIRSLPCVTPEMAWPFPAREGSCFLSVCLSEFTGTAVAKTHTCVSQQNVTGSQTWVGAGCLSPRCGQGGLPCSSRSSFLSYGLWVTWPAQVAVAKCHRLGGFPSRRNFSRSWGLESRDEVPAKAVSGQILLPRLWSEASPLWARVAE